MRITHDMIRKRKKGSSMDLWCRVFETVLRPSKQQSFYLNNQWSSSDQTILPTLTWSRQIGQTEDVLTFRFTCSTRILIQPNIVNGKFVSKKYPVLVYPVIFLSF